MELNLSNTLLAGDHRLIDHIVGEVKSQGLFDQFRKECIADVDTKPAYQNLRTRVESSVNSFLDKQIWTPDLNKNQLRETLRKHIHDAPYLDAGVERIVDQVVNPKVYSVFMPQIEDVVYKFLGIERPKTRERDLACGLKDLLPKDLDPVSPESDKNSLKDVSLESIDAIDELNAVKEENGINYTEDKHHNLEDAEENNKSINCDNEDVNIDENVSEGTYRTSNKTDNNLNSSTKSDEKMEEEEEDSPTFEPIDIMNLHESNISNDSHLSGISELTSHRSRSPGGSNELSQDNFEYNSNQDSQFSKVSSDSRLSIVTDFESSNHALPLSLDVKDDMPRDKFDTKNLKDNFRAIRDLDNLKSKTFKTSADSMKHKDPPEQKDSKSSKHSSSIKEISHDNTCSGKDKYDNKISKDKTRISESSKSKSSKEKIQNKDSKFLKDKDGDRKRQSGYSSSKYEKYSSSKNKERHDQGSKSNDKIKDNIEIYKENSIELKSDKIKDIDKKENVTKEAKDLKDLYKEKIRELREKKELTEKEKLNKDKDSKYSKEYKDKRDSSRDKKTSYRKDHKSSSTKNFSNHSDSKTSKSSDKISDGKDKKIESKDRGKRDDKRSHKDTLKDKRDHSIAKSESSDKLEKQRREDKSNTKKESKMVNDKSKKDVKTSTVSKTFEKSEKVEEKKDTRTDLQLKDRKRKDKEKTKSKDDHSSLRKNSNDRRSTDRDGSNGSNTKSSQSSNSGSNIISGKSGSSSITRESNYVNNSNSETSDSIEGTRINELKSASEFSGKQSKRSNEYVGKSTIDSTYYDNKVTKYHDSNFSGETSLPLKKRPLSNEDDSSLMELKIKKPKFAKNFQEAKKLMKIRKQMEKQQRKEREVSRKNEKKVEQKVETAIQNKSKDENSLENVPDHERVQIIEISNEEYDEPYPETDLTLEERTRMLLESEVFSNKLLQQQQMNLKAELANMDLSVTKVISEKFSETIEERIGGKLDVEEKSDSREKNHVSTSDSNISTFNKEFEHSQANDNLAESNDKNEHGEIKQMKIDSPSLNDLKLEVGFSVSRTNENTDEKDLKEKIKSEDVNTNFDENKVNVKIESLLITGIEKTKRFEAIKQERIQTMSSDTASSISSDCKYFKADTEQSTKFSNFLEGVELEESTTLEDMIESMGGQVVSSISKSMAPPLPKRAYISSPLTDIPLHNVDNNNDGLQDESFSAIKKRRLITPKRSKSTGGNSACASPASMVNGENFVMPLSPDSDVSASSEKTLTSCSSKDDKGRQRSSQRYSSDDLYKPRPLFASSSRRSRRSNNQT